MSITLVTGTPGSGKTLYTVWWIDKQQKAGRRILVDGVRDLAIEHIEVDEPWLRQWHTLAEANDLIVIDEAQRIYPPVSISTKPTPDIQELHTHRHLGVDFVLITQHPQRLNKTVRDLVGRHVHVRRIFGMNRAMLYEWDHAHNISSMRDAVKTLWNYPRDVFKLYTSAEVHTKQKSVIPKALFLLPIALIAAIVFAYRAFVGVHGGFGVAGANAGVGPGPGVSGGSVAAGAVIASSPSVTWRVVGRYLVDANSYVVLADSAGQIRVVRSDGFMGGGVHTDGSVDGVHVAGWTGRVTGPGAGKK